MENFNCASSRIIQESVPGKQITLLHIIASPDKSLYMKLGLEESGEAIGIMTITPYEGVIIAADIATKSAAIEIGFLDRFGGSLLFVGDVASVDAALVAIQTYFKNKLMYNCVDITRT